MFVLGASGQIQVAKIRKAGLFAMTLWEVEVELHCPELDRSALDRSALDRDAASGELDTAWLRQCLQDVLDPLDRQALDEHPAFAPRGVSSARLARYVCNALLQVCRRTLTNPAAGCVRVIVRESPPHTWAGYTGWLKDA